MPSHIQSPLSRILHKAKTHKGRRMQAAKEPQFHETPKQTLFLRGQNTAPLVTQCLSDLYLLKKGSSVKLQRNNRIYPFEDTSYLEQLCCRAECGLFLLANHSKKRPNNLVCGRVFDGKVLDLLEMGVESYRAVSDFKTDLISVSSQPIVLFMGPQFEAELSKVKNLFLDLFRGPTNNRLAASSIEHVVLFAANDVTRVHMRVYRVAREGRNVSGIQEMGPRIGMKIRRHNPPDEKLFRKSLKVATVGQIRHARNVSYSREGSQLGRVHMERQDYSKLQTRKRKALKVSSAGKKEQRMDTD